MLIGTQAHVTLEIVYFTVAMCRHKKELIYSKSHTFPSISAASLKLSPQ